MAHEPNLISTTIERTGGKIGESLREIFKHDIKILFFDKFFYAEQNFLANYNPTVKNNSESFNTLMSKLDNLRGVDEIVDALIEYYKKFGCGDIADYRAFRFDETTKNLIGIKYFETIHLDDLIGYAHQKELLTKNTNASLPIGVRWYSMPASAAISSWF